MESSLHEIKQISKAADHESHLVDWLQENVAKPMYNGLISDANSTVNVINGISSQHVLDKMQPYEIAPSHNLGTQITQAVSSGIGGALPFIVAGGAIGAVAKVAGYAFLNSTAARVAINVVPTGIIDLGRDRAPGQSWLGNAASDAVSMGVGVGAGSVVSAGMATLVRLAGTALVGASISDGQMAVSSLMSGSAPTKEDYLIHGISGAILSMGLPAISRGVNNVADIAVEGVAANENMPLSNMPGQTKNASLPDFKIHSDGAGESTLRLSAPGVAGAQEPIRFTEGGVKTQGNTQPLANGAKVEISGSSQVPENSTHDFAAFTRTDADYGQSTKGKWTGYQNYYDNIRAKRDFLVQSFARVETSDLSSERLSQKLYGAEIKREWTEFKDNTYRPSSSTLVDSETIQDRNPIVFGGAGVNILREAGAAAAIEEVLGPDVWQKHKLTGVSAGGILATALANGEKPWQVVQDTLDSQQVNIWNPNTYIGYYEGFFHGLSEGKIVFSLEPAWGRKVAENGWKWPERDNLRLAAAHEEADGNFKTVFLGKEVPLAKGLAATGAFRGIFEEVEIAGQKLVDGGHAQLNPVAPWEENKTSLNPLFHSSEPPSIVMRVEAPTNMPERLQFPNVFFNPQGMMLRSMYERAIEAGRKNLFHAEVADKDLLVSLDTDTATLDFAVTKDKAWRMYEESRQSTLQALEEGIKQGKIRKPLSAEESKQTLQGVGKSFAQSYNEY